MRRKIAHDRLYYCINVPFSYPSGYRDRKEYSQRSELSPSTITYIENLPASQPQRRMAESFTLIPFV